MNAFKYRKILYFISAVILTTLCTQVYWNYKNYRIGKQQLINDVQSSIDDAVDHYFTGLATETSFELFSVSKGDSVGFKSRSSFVVRDTTVYSTNDHGTLDTINGAITIVKSDWKDSTNFDISINHVLDSLHLKTHEFDSILSGSRETGRFSSQFDPALAEELSSKMMVIFSENEFSLETIDSLLTEELNRKNISIPFGLTYLEHDQPIDSIRPNIIKNASLVSSTHSPYLLHTDNLKVFYANITLAVLKKNLMGIFLSFILVGAVIACLIYLLKIIQKQKELAAVKNDLISNITHEFKTPIATIGIAMEAIENFNNENDTAKNIRYAKISRTQVNKLNTMVEKLLETATLDSDKLELNKEPHNLVELLQSASQKEEIMMGSKNISFHSSSDEIIVLIDVFHFENAINNVIDNAIKYGGDEISITITNENSTIAISICDSGNGLTPAHKRQLFEKFYRVPKGNTHDVKGFGIGLYYTKTIIEKHHGKIELSLKPSTCFNISLPNG